MSDEAPPAVPYLQLCCIIFSQALTDLNFGLLAPFFPGVCADRGVSHSTVGAIFTTQQAFALLTTPAVPWLGRRTRPMAVLLSTLAAQGALSVLWSFVGRLDGTTAFVTVSFALRGCQGALQGVFEGMSCAMLIKAAPDGWVGYVMGWSEAGRSLGYMLGPLLGGVLYDAGGFALPFLTVAGFMLVMLVLLSAVMRRAAARDASAAIVHSGDAIPEAPTITMWQLFKAPGVAAGLTVTFALFVVISSLDPTVQPFLAQPPLRLSSATVGLFFLLVVVAYVILSVISGSIAARAGDLVSLNVALLITAVGLLFTGPSPLLYHALPALPQHSLPLIVASFATFGAGAGLTVAPTNNLMVSAANSRGISMDNAGDQLGTLSTLSYSLGATVGPLVGGVIVQTLGGPLVGYQWLNTILAFFTAAAAVALTPVFLRSTRAPQGSLHVPLVDPVADDVVVPAGAAASISDPMLPRTEA